MASTHACPADDRGQWPEQLAPAKLNLAINPNPCVKPIVWAHAPLSQSACGHELAEHLRATALLTAQFLPPGVPEAWGELLGRYHDAGKARTDWQNFIHAAGAGAENAHLEDSEREGNPRKHGPPHSPEGALRVLAAAGSGDIRRGMKSYAAMALAWAIYGHHSGLRNHQELLSRLGEIADGRKPSPEIEAFFAGMTPSCDLPDLPPWITKVGKEEGMRRYELFVRMLFSALVDADFLDTERYFAGAGSQEAATRSALREAPVPSLEACQTFLGPKLAALDAAALTEISASTREINTLRKGVREACIEVADQPSGLFSLTVPTGGAKTLASLAFALLHALRNGQQRVIVAVPFTSVTEQTASVFRAFLPENAVLEHHSNLDPAKETARSRVASENWDAPVVVTTQVQLFESLLGNRPSRCRKLHNLCNAVLILDEVQSLPSPYLRPILGLLDELARHYGATVLLTTATQPELHTRELGAQRFLGLRERPYEIIPSELGNALWSKLRRVRVHWPADWDGDLRTKDEPWNVLAARMADGPQALAITHLKTDALALCKALEAREFPVLHLSTSMCPAHRRSVLRQVKARLEDGKPCHLISTQLIEAGVDIDFPVVYRAMAGLEALAQSAGRCNRNGRLAPELGNFFIFEAPTEPPRDLLTARDVTRSMLLNGLPDLLAPEAFVAYFGRLHAAKGDLLDLHGIQVLREALKFEEVAEQTRLVDSPAEPVFVSYDGEARSAIDALRWGGPSRPVLRRLQPYTVNVFQNQLKALQTEGAIERTHDFQVLVSDIHYHQRYGLTTSFDADHALIC